MIMFVEVFREQMVISTVDGYIRDLTEAETTTTTTRTSENNSFNYQNTYSARALKTLVHLLVVLCKTTT